MHLGCIWDAAEKTILGRFEALCAASCAAEGCRRIAVCQGGINNNFWETVEKE